ncbi:MAG: hypothetical protein HOQ35_14250 [Acidobacteriaceae bacterium]|nr:hypothetical protein [Acidobacteriaceae bacterium]
MPLSSSQLRRELSARGLALEREHETTYGRDDLHTPSVLFQEDELGQHGNFHPSSYRRILANPAWAARLTKAYTASSRVAYAAARRRKELDCANSSDALLMNIVCYPGLLARPQVCALLGIAPGLTPEFGVRMKAPQHGTRSDRSEVDLVLGHLLNEAKLTETGFQTARPALIERYRDLEEVFFLEDLPRNSRGDYLHYQLLRGALAAHHSGKIYLVLCDARRSDLREAWFQIIRCVRTADLRSRLALLTWQELAATVPKGLAAFLERKYRLHGAP